MSKKFVNLTPHAINVFNQDGTSQVLVIEPSGIIARVATKTEFFSEESGVPLLVTGYGEVQDLPPMEDGTIYVVSLLVRQAVPDRTDLASPGELLRDSEGKPIGCKGLSVGGASKNGKYLVHERFMRRVAGAQGAVAGMAGSDIGDYILDDYAFAVLDGRTEDSGDMAELMQLESDGVIRSVKTDKGTVVHLWLREGDQNFFKKMTLKEAIRLAKGS